MTLKKIFFLMIIASALTACKWMNQKVGLGDQEKNYHTAQAEAPLKLPQNLSASQIGHNTEALPTVNQSQVLNQIPLPPGSLAQDVADGKVAKKTLDQSLPKEP